MKQANKDIQSTSLHIEFSVLTTLQLIFTNLPKIINNTFKTLLNPFITG